MLQNKRLMAIIKKRPIMTRLCITTVFLLQLTLAFGQTDTTKRINSKWTVGTILLSEGSNSDNKTFTPNFFNGIITKRHLDNFTLRLGIEYVQLSFKSDVQNWPDYLNTYGYTKNEGMLRLGVEKGLVIKKYFKPYFALDLTAIKSYSDKTLQGGFVGIYERHLIHQTGFGAMPTIGFEFLITKYLSVALETRLRLIYINTIDNIDNLYDSEGYYTENDKQFEITYNRIGALTIDFNF